jgi:hypothetical protein
VTVQMDAHCTIDAYGGALWDIRCMVILDVYSSKVY